MKCATLVWYFLDKNVSIKYHTSTVYDKECRRVFCCNLLYANCLNICTVVNPVKIILQYRLYFFLFLLIYPALVPAAATVREFGGMRATYNGTGVMTVNPTLADNVWGITITGVSFDEKRGTLSIKPTSKNKNAVFIDSIYCDGNINSINITFPPGKNQTGCIRNIFVDGYLKILKVTGGDLGAPDGYDGEVYVNGYVNMINVKGKKYNVPGTTLTEFWGGNIWAEITVIDTLQKIMIKGGNLHYTPYQGIQGFVQVGGHLKMIAVDGVVVKTNRADSSSSVLYGGGMKTDLYADLLEINQIRLKGGSLYGAGIYCRSINKLSITGQGLGDPRPMYPLAAQGMFNTLIETKDPYLDFKDCGVKNVTVKNGSVRDCNFAIKGNVNGFKITGDTSRDVGNVSNVIMRVGYEGPVTQNNKPEITPNQFKDSAIVDSRLVVPFTVNNTDADETMTVRIQQRGPALDAVISNYSGQVFSGTNLWHITDNVQSGMFVWIPPSYLEGLYSNLIVRVIDNGTPNLYDELNLILSVVVSNVAPTLILDPPDSHRIVSLLIETNLAWDATIQDPNLGQLVTLTVEENGGAPYLGLTSTNTGDRQYAVWATNTLAIGVYSNIVFTAIDVEGLKDSQTVIVTVTSNSPPVVTTSLLLDDAVSAVSNTLSFTVFALDDETNTLTFSRPVELPDAADYSDILFGDIMEASNLFSWTPGVGDTGLYLWTFDVYDANPTVQTGSVTVTVLITNGLNTARSALESTPLPLQEPIGSYAGQIGNITVAGDTWYSDFICGAIDSTPYDWENATYLGRIKTMNMSGTSESNLFVSGRTINIQNSELFDFDANEVWVDGTQQTGP